MFFSPSFCNFHGQYCSPVTCFLQKTLLWASHTANSYFPIWKWDQLSFSNGIFLCTKSVMFGCIRLVEIVAQFSWLHDAPLFSPRERKSCCHSWGGLMMLCVSDTRLWCYDYTQFCHVWFFFNLIWPHCFFDCLTCFCGVSSVQFFWLLCSPWEEQVLNPLHHMYTESRLLEIKRRIYDS